MLDERKIVKTLMLILAFAFVLRIFLIIIPEVIHNDGIEYIRHAKQISSGDWSGGKSPPLYPSLIALVQMITQDYEMAGIWVSVIFGTLIVLPIFYLGRSIFDEKVGFLSALFATVHPSLNISSGSVLTESTYHFFLATSVLFSWNAFSKGKFYHLLALDEAALSALVKRGIQHSQQEGVDLVGLIVPQGHLYYKILRKMGFLSSFKKFLFMVYPNSDKEMILSPEKWYVNWGDTDVI